MEWYEPEVRELERAYANRVNGNAGKVKPPVFYGSSSIRLWTTLADDFDPRVFNVGFGGSTLQACDYFFMRLVAPLKPCSVLLYAGDNDLGDGRTAEQAFTWYLSLADKVANVLGEIPFGFISVKPSPVRYPLIDRIKKLNELVQGAVEKRPYAYYVDVFSRMLDQNGKPCTKYYQPDGLHMNHDGYLLWSEILDAYRHQIFTV